MLPVVLSPVAPRASNRGSRALSRGPPKGRWPGTHPEKSLATTAHPCRTRGSMWAITRWVAPESEVSRGVADAAHLADAWWSPCAKPTRGGHQGRLCQAPRNSAVTGIALFLAGRWTGT